MNYSSIYIVRHGEKKSRLHLIDCLDQRGIQRSYHLLKVFNDKTLPKPEYIFANHFFDQIDCQRCIQLGIPLADKLNIKINDDYGTVFWIGSDHKIVNKIQEIIAKKHTNILIIWEHVNVIILCKLLGVQYTPHWPDHDYDTIYEIKIFDNKNVTFKILKQHFKYQNNIKMKPLSKQKFYDNKWKIHMHLFMVCIVLMLFFTIHNVSSK